MEKTKKIVWKIHGNDKNAKGTYEKTPWKTNLKMKSNIIVTHEHTVRLNELHGMHNILRNDILDDIVTISAERYSSFSCLNSLIESVLGLTVKNI